MAFLLFCLFQESIHEIGIRKDKRRKIGIVVNPKHQLGYFSDFVLWLYMKRDFINISTFMEIITLLFYGKDHLSQHLISHIFIEF